ncbi:hypothetical protein GCM10011506_26550 [Marivirga lumbricoides]|uniref:DUF2154 domain-containing protein n=1 Tax=Marivirga lumbricoides TaxID=1046115 RepID=A0ABQ1MIV1_9BACT|nr:hypothetical protein GCM10011506_26550 [Marivirga lumbricoides]
MSNKLFAFSTLLVFSVISNCYTQELHKHFEVAQSSNTDKVALSVFTKAGSSFINGVSSVKPLEIYSENENNIAASTYKIQEFQDHKYVEANLTCKNHVGLNFTEAIAKNIFSPDIDAKDVWQIKLSENTLYNLSLNYLLGSAEIDLSRLSVERLKVNSGSADVFLNYADGKRNAVAMDTFFVKVNLGDIVVENLNLALAKEIIAEVGFGSIYLNCGNNWQINSKVSASVGAGSMTIHLPPDDIPVLVRIKNSALCHIKLASDYKKVGHNLYGNAAYMKNKQEFLEFSLDVGMGSISFLH